MIDREARKPCWLSLNILFTGPLMGNWLNSVCSSSLEKMGKTEIVQYFETSVGSPDLKIGVISADFMVTGKMM